MPEEIHELHEHAEHAQHDPTLAPITITMAVLAVLVAIVSLLVHKATTQEILLQNKASDLWAYFQAKSIRRHNYELFTDLISVLDVKNTAKTEALKSQYAQQAQQYSEQQNQIGEQAKALEEGVEHQHHRATRFELSEVFMEVALVISSMTLLTRRRGYWYFGTALTL
ncbi:MAG: DUF4337 domain-containing protein, partial [Candidatus Dormibacteraceae bacterium]